MSNVFFSVLDPGTLRLAITVVLVPVRCPVLALEVGKEEDEAAASPNRARPEAADRGRRPLRRGEGERDRRRSSREGGLPGMYLNHLIVI